jgi:hypothetical protein
MDDGACFSRLFYISRGIHPPGKGDGQDLGGNRPWTMDDGPWPMVVPDGNFAYEPIKTIPLINAKPNKNN